MKNERLGCLLELYDEEIISKPQLIMALQNAHKTKAEPVHYYKRHKRMLTSEVVLSELSTIPKPTIEIARKLAKRLGFRPSRIAHATCEHLIALFKLKKAYRVKARRGYAYGLEIARGSVKIFDGAKTTTEEI